MNKEVKTLVAKIKATKILSIDIAGLDKKRALLALKQIEGMYQTNLFMLRDMVSEDHDPFVYFSNGNVTYSHELKDGIISIYEEKYELI